MATRRLPVDRGLTSRMFLTLFLLAALYLFFGWVLLQAGAGIQGMVIFLGLMLLAQYYFSDRLALLSMGAREVSPREAPQLHDMVGRLAALADLPKPRVAISPLGIPNAFATGRDPQHAWVAVTRGLLDRLAPHELEAVLAHEVAHIKNRDVAIITFASFFATLAGYLTQHLFYVGMFGGFGGRRDERGGANAALLVYLVSLLVYVLSFFLIRALSRYREFAADRGAAILTGAPSHLASALIKISRQLQAVPQRDLREVEALNAFFILPAVGDGLAELFSTHPSLERRLEYLRKIEAEMRR